MALAPAIIEIKDPLTLSVYNTQDVVVTEEEGKITALEIPNIATITLGRKVKTGKPKQIYKINSITNRVAPGQPIYDLRIAHRTKASMYVLPMLPGPKEAFFFHQFFMNCFVAVPDEENVIALLYRFSGLKVFVEFEDALKKLSTFKRMEDIGPTTLYVFEVPKRWAKDYELFIAGKYSQMSEAYKQRILEFHHVDKRNVYGQILYKDEETALDRRHHVENMIGQPLHPDAELQSVPEMSLETYDPEVYGL